MFVARKPSSHCLSRFAPSSDGRICADGRSEEELGLVYPQGGAPLPVFIPLREFAAELSKESCSLLDYLGTHLRQHMLNLEPGYLQQALELGPLDGQDPAPWVPQAVGLQPLGGAGSAGGRPAAALHGWS